MDWNNDGKVDWKDYAILDSATSGEGKNNYSGDGNGTGCLNIILVVLFAFYILDLVIKIFD